VNFTVKISGISKKHGSVQALNNVSFEVGKGELFGLIGPDGAGKSTLFRILATLLLPDSGTATVIGHDVVKAYKKIRNITGYMPGRFSLYQDLSVEENLRFFASIFNTTIEKNYHLIKDIYSQIEPFKDRLAGKLSGGMKQKLALSCAMIHKPEILILDEPTTGVDAVSRKEFWEMLKKLQGAGITILVSTPYMDEASLCDRVGLIQNGELLSIDSPENIIRSYAWPIIAVTAKNMYALYFDLMNYEHARTVFRFGDSIHVTLMQDIDIQEHLYDFLHEKGHREIRISEIDPGVEDCFMSLMKTEANDE